MRRIQRSAHIDAPPARVYAFLSDPTNLPLWQTGVISSERTSPPPTVAGSTGRAVFDVMGQQMTANTTVREAVPDRRLVVASSVGGMSVVGSLDLVPADGGTQVTFKSEVKAESIFMGPLERLVADAAEKELDPSLARLRAALSALPE
ncbi:MAG TPA: SRPBCC family protein [Candidatus Limnocylindria bacterium]|nr:SRPBCC family protein [Candidatus Limnocylindria bacterium]